MDIRPIRIKIVWLAGLVAWFGIYEPLGVEVWPIGKWLKPMFGGDVSCAALANISAMRNSCSRFFFLPLLFEMPRISPLFFSLPLPSSWSAWVKFLPLPLNYLLPRLKLVCLILLATSFCQELQQFFVYLFLNFHQYQE